MITLMILTISPLYLPTIEKILNKKVSGGDLIACKSLLLTTVSISKKQLKNAFNKILEDLNADITDFTTIHSEDQNLKRIRKIERFIDKIDFIIKKKLKKT